MTSPGDSKLIQLYLERQTKKIGISPYDLHRETISAILVEHCKSKWEVQNSMFSFLRKDHQFSILWFAVLRPYMKLFSQFSMEYSIDKTTSNNSRVTAALPGYSVNQFISLEIFLHPLMQIPYGFNLSHKFLKTV